MEKWRKVKRGMWGKEGGTKSIASAPVWSEAKQFPVLDHSFCSINTKVLQFWDFLPGKRGFPIFFKQIWTSLSSFLIAKSIDFLCLLLTIWLWVIDGASLSLICNRSVILLLLSRLLWGLCCEYVLWWYQLNNEIQGNWNPALNQVLLITGFRREACGWGQWHLSLQNKCAFPLFAFVDSFSTGLSGEFLLPRTGQPKI